jgi:Predicted membrane protein (DUF2207) C-terminal domain
VTRPDTAVFAAAQAIDPNPALVAATVVVLAGAVATLAVLWARTRPPRPEVGPVEMEGGSETPALVDLLTGGFRVEDDAVPATVVDLAARRWFDIEEVAGGNVIVRLRTGRDELTPYEQRVRRHVERRAIGGVAPAEALTIGPEGVSKRWWRGFAREVTRHGRALGLCRRRWGLRDLALVWLSVAAAWLMLAVTAATAPRVEAAGSWGDPGAVAVTLSLGLLLGLTEIARRITRSGAQAETPAGMAAASRWLGVREYLATTGSFEEAPAASVAIWERQLAYATAMGLAPVVQRQLPFETEHDRQAWSRANGRWRRVRIRYLSARPGWGLAPWTAAATGAFQSTFVAIIAWVGLQFARESIDVSSLPESSQDWLPIAGLAVAVVAALVLAWTATKLVLGLADLFPRRTIEGEVVRHREYMAGHRLPRGLQWFLGSDSGTPGGDRNHRRRVRRHIAIDDGSRDRIIAYEVRPEIFRSVRQGARVRARVTPRLGYVAGIEELSEPDSIPPGPADRN